MTTCSRHFNGTTCEAVGHVSDGLVEGHTCVTSDGVRIRIGLRVLDYDRKLGTVTGPPQSHVVDGVELYPCDGRGWSGYPYPNVGVAERSGLSQGCWWEVTPDGTTGRGPSFDGSRMTTRGVPRQETAAEQHLAIAVEALQQGLEHLETAYDNGEFGEPAMSHDAARAMGDLRGALHTLGRQTIREGGDG